MNPYESTNIAGAATTVVKTGRGTLARIIVNKAVLSGIITIYDNTSAAGKKIATITHPSTLLQNQYQLDFSARVLVGITVVTSAADDITVIWE